MPALQAAVCQLITWTTPAAAPPSYSLLLRAESPTTHSAQMSIVACRKLSAQNRDLAGEMFGLIKGIFPDEVTWKKIAVFAAELSYHSSNFMTISL